MVCFFIDKNYCNLRHSKEEQIFINNFVSGESSGLLLQKCGEFLYLLISLYENACTYSGQTVKALF